MVTLLHLQSGISAIRQNRPTGFRLQYDETIYRFLLRQQRFQLFRLAPNILGLPKIQTDFFAR